jgi:hypothetical protein
MDTAEEKFELDLYRLIAKAKILTNAAEGQDNKERWTHVTLTLQKALDDFRERA